MFKIRKSIDIDFAHTVAGHPGACINVHGHTWKFEVEVAARVLNDNGFVIDFAELKRDVLQPAHLLLDHSYAVGPGVFTPEGRKALEGLGRVCVATRDEVVIGEDDVVELGYKHLEGSELNGARNEIVGGIKVAVFPFNPTSELLAKWLFDLAASRLGNSRVAIVGAHIYETLHPVEAVASYVWAGGYPL